MLPQLAFAPFSDQQAESKMPPVVVDPGGGDAANEPAGTDVAKRKSAKKQSGDRHKESFMCRIPDAVAKQFDVLVKLNHSDRTEEIRRACIEYLRGKGLWPPPEQAPGKPATGA